MGDLDYMGPAEISMGPASRIPVICRYIAAAVADAGKGPACAGYARSRVDEYLKKGYMLAGKTEPLLKGPLHEMLDRHDFWSHDEIGKIEESYCVQATAPKITLENGEPYDARAVPFTRKGRSGAVYSFDGRVDGKPFVNLGRQPGCDDLYSAYKASDDCSEDLAIVIPEPCDERLAHLAKSLGLELYLP
jgi:hypothetical protein